MIKPVLHSCTISTVKHLFLLQPPAQRNIHQRQHQSNSLLLWASGLIEHIKPRSAARRHNRQSSVKAVRIGIDLNDYAVGNRSIDHFLQVDFVWLAPQ